MAVVVAQEYTVSTTNATPTVIANLGAFNDKAILIEYVITGIKTNATRDEWYYKNGVISFVRSSATNRVADGPIWENGGPLWSYSSAWAAGAGNTVECTVTGETSEDVDWTLFVKFLHYASG